MKIYVVTREDVGGEPYPIEAFKEEGDAWDSIQGKSSEIVSFDVHEVYLK